MNTIGSKIATQIRQASFNPLGIEANMYTGDQVVAMYAYNIKPSSWSQISWCNLGCSSSDGCHTFGIAGREMGLMNSFDYLLAVALEAVFPQVTLANTPPPVPYTITLPTAVGSTVTETLPLYAYVSNGDSGISAGTIVVGTLSTLTSGTTGLGLPSFDIFPFVSNSPRHLVSWSQYVLLALIEYLTLRVNGVEYENFDRNVLFNALQFRMRQDVFPIAVEDATSFRASQVAASVGNAPPSVLGGMSEDSRYKAFTVPFSFSTSAMADRGQNGKHLSAFPILLCCESSVCMDVTTIPDLRDLLVLQEETMTDYSCNSVVLAAPLSLFSSTPGTLVGNVVISNGTTNYNIPSSSLTNVLSIPAGIVGTSTGVTVTMTPTNPGAQSVLPPQQGCGGCHGGCGSFPGLGNSCGCSLPTGQSISRTFSPLTLGALGVAYLRQTGEYTPVTRYHALNPRSPLGKDVDYSKWIVSGESSLRVKLHARAQGATVTDFERGMTKVDCRDKKFLYESYSYSSDTTVLPGSEHRITLCRSPGQFKYAYTFAENETSRLQGQFFNFTNSTEFNIVADSELMRTKFVFEGHDSLLYFKQKIDGYDDFHARAKFITYVDNPLFGQRAPRVTGLHIVPRYANWINSIYPDGSVNLDEIKCAELEVKTTPSALYSSCCCADFGKSNTIRYNLHTVAVLWRIAIFEISL